MKCDSKQYAIFGRCTVQVYMVCAAGRSNLSLYSRVVLCLLQITHDDDIIPGWEGKIVAWIEEDHG